MLELFVLVVFVMAIIAINKANSAIRENASLRDELSRLRRHVEDKPAVERQDRREQAAVQPAAGSGFPQHTPTRAASIAPPPVSEVAASPSPWAVC
jgi:hypothetical protein